MGHEASYRRGLAMGNLSAMGDFLFPERHLFQACFKVSFKSSYSQSLQLRCSNPLGPLLS